MKNIISIAFLTLLTLTSCQQAKQKLFEVSSQQLNKQCPITIDEVTRLDSTNYSNGDNIFAYYYTLTGAADNPDMTITTKEHLLKTLPENIKSAEDMKAYREMKVTLLYVYFSDKTHKELLSVTITPDMYK